MSRSVHIPYQIDPTANRNHYYETLWKKKALELLATHCASLDGMSLLDYGSGRGETMEMAASMGMKVRGTDLDPECVRLSSAFGPCELLDAENPLQQFGAGSVDVVATFHVLEHVPNPSSILRQLAGISRKYVLVAVPNLRKIPDLLRQKRNVVRINEGHLQSWDHSHLLNMAEKHCGLRHVAWTFDQVKIPIISSVVPKYFGQKAAISLETGILLKLFPYQATSIIGLFEKA